MGFKAYFSNVFNLVDYFSLVLYAMSFTVRYVSYVKVTSLRILSNLIVECIPNETVNLCLYSGDVVLSSNVWSIVLNLYPPIKLLVYKL